MKLILLLSLALATSLSISSDASSLSTDIDQGAIAAVPLIANPHYKRNTPAHIQKLNKRYPNIKIQAGGGDNGVVSSGTTGRVTLVNVNSDLEYYGTVKVGTPAQPLRLIFDTGSSDIWFPSTACSTPACKSKHRTRFNPSSSSTYKKDDRPWKVEYGDGSVVSGHLASEIINVGGVQVRQTIGLATNVSSQFKNSPEDGIFGLGFGALTSVKGIDTFMNNAINGPLKQPLVSVFLPSSHRNGGQGGHVLFGGIDHSRFNDKLHYVPVTQRGYWQVKLDAFKVPALSSSNSTGVRVSSLWILMTMDHLQWSTPSA
ncbi:MAG: aspartic peptidase domain-containing protein [Linnemannia gamsii]|nr:MAG: aspartic peptidase domain-containing protein [Linnemannia gamsii]